MTDSNKNLGKLIGAYGISPACLQRAAFISILSFVFFLAMMAGFYLRQNIVYFLLATAFLLVYLFTMFSWVLQRKTELRIFESGFSFKKNSVRWDAIKEVDRDGVVNTTDGKKLTIPRSIRDFDILLNVIQTKAPRQE
jgi:hypothetical protein